MLLLLRGVLIRVFKILFRISFRYKVIKCLNNVQSPIVGYKLYIIPARGNTTKLLLYAHVDLIAITCTG